MKPVGRGVRAVGTHTGFKCKYIEKYKKRLSENKYKKGRLKKIQTAFKIIMDRFFGYPISATFQDFSAQKKEYSNCIISVTLGSAM